MKNFLTLVTFVCVLSSTFAQNFTFLYPNNNYDIGFGKFQDCTKHISYVVNGPLFVGDGTPVGGYVVTEHRYNKKTQKYYSISLQKKPWVEPSDYPGNFSNDNGIFGLTKQGKMILQRYEDWIHTPEYLLWGFQNGMILVLQGKNLHNKSNPSRYIRSGVGYRDDGSLVVAISNQPVTFYELSEALRLQDCNNAIYLDGSTAAVGYASPQITVGFDPTAIKLQFYH